METFLKWIDHGLLSMGLSSATSHAVDNYLAILIAFLLSLLVTWLANRYLIPVICRFVNHTHTRWDDLLLNPRVLRSLCRLLPPFILYHAVPFFSAGSEIPGWIDIGCRIYLSVGFMALGTSVVKTAYTVWDTFDKLKDKPIKGFLQVVNLLIYIVTGIVIVSILLDKSPVHLLTGLGASAAIVSLIFKDTIVNFISGIQLSAHDMLRPGDWITVSKHGINGTVEDITLNTVKIRNFDHTILTIPPYLLVNEPFQNWRYMKESGSRRMVQTLCIDIAYLSFQTIFFERFIAFFRVRANVGFFIITIDFIGYLGTLAILLFKELGAPHIDWPLFYNEMSIWIGVACCITFVCSMAYLAQAGQPRHKSTEQAGRQAVGGLMAAN